MPRIEFAREFVEVRVADRIIKDTIFRQVARYQYMAIRQDDAAEYHVQLFVKVYLYAADGDGLGPAMQGKGLTPYMEELVADNNTLVAVPTGQILVTKAATGPGVSQQQVDADWQASTAAFDQQQDTMLQGDFFAKMAKTQPIYFEAMVRQHIEQADAMGRFA